MSASQAQPTQQAQRTYPERAVRGEIEAANENGIKVAGEWFDFGTYYQGVRPGRGQVVEAVARGRFLRRVTVLGGDGPDTSGDPVDAPEDGFADPLPPPADDDDDPATWRPSGAGAAPRRVATPLTRGAGPAPLRTRPEERVADAPGASDASRATRAAPTSPALPAVPPSPRATGLAGLRAAALAAAAHFHSGRGGEEDEVYGTAYRFLAWLTEEEDGV
jgi:hypothetical protein